IVHRIRYFVPFWGVGRRTGLSRICRLRRDRWLDARLKDNGLGVPVWTLNALAVSAQCDSRLSWRTRSARTVVEVSSPVAQVKRTVHCDLDLVPFVIALQIVWTVSQSVEIAVRVHHARGGLSEAIIVVQGLAAGGFRHVGHQHMLLRHAGSDVGGKPAGVNGVKRDPLGFKLVIDLAQKLARWQAGWIGPQK